MREVGFNELRGKVLDIEVEDRRLIIRLEGEEVSLHPSVWFEIDSAVIYKLRFDMDS